MAALVIVGVSLVLNEMRALAEPVVEQRALQVPLLLSRGLDGACRFSLDLEP